MPEMMEVLAIREYLDKKTGEKRTGYTKIGMAFSLKGGSKDGWMVNLDALPVGGRLLLKPRTERDDRRSSSPETAPDAGDDSIPF